MTLCESVQATHFGKMTVDLMMCDRGPFISRCAVDGILVVS